MSNFSRWSASAGLGRHQVWRVRVDTGCMSLKYGHLAVLAVYLLLPYQAVEAANDRYGATLVNSTWSMQDSAGQCVLGHPIPQLGEARFIQAAGKPLVFRLIIPQESQFARHVSWQIRPLPWKHNAEPGDLGQQALNGNSKLLELSAEDSIRLYQAVEQGMSADFVFSDGAEDRAAITVTVSAVRFTGQIMAFQRCEAGLIKLAAEPGKAQIGKVTLEFQIPFAANSHEIGAAARAILGDRARDYRISNSRSRILIAGHTDNLDSVGDTARLAQRRAREVKGYLVRRGLPADRIDIRQSSKRAAPGPASAVELPRVTVWLVN